MQRRAEKLDDHYGELLAFVRRRVGPDADPEDVVQDVYAAAAAALARSGDVSTPTLAWLYTVARRRLVDRLRRRRPDVVSLQAVGELQAPRLEYGREVARALHAALAALPEGHRHVIVLRLLEGRSFADVAARLGVSEEACRMRFMRALERMRRALEEEGVTP